VPSVPAIPLDRLRARARELRERPGGPSGGEVERALNDVYAEVIGLEVTRTRIRRRMLEHLVDDPEAAHEDGLALEGLDTAIGALRAVLAELRALPVPPVQPGARPEHERESATPRRNVR
jgi:hypothetical protein